MTPFICSHRQHAPRPVLPVRLAVGDRTIAAGQIFQIAEDPEVEIDELTYKRVMQIEKRKADPPNEWTVPAASVTAMELRLA